MILTLTIISAFGFAIESVEWVEYGLNRGLNKGFYHVMYQIIKHSFIHSCLQYVC